MYNFEILPNEFLSQKIQAFYHTLYLGFKEPGNPDFLNILKNLFCQNVLNGAVKELEDTLLQDLPQFLQLKNPLTVCVVPRSKADYRPEQLLFKSTIQNAVNRINGFCDGTDYIKRHTNTKTTHLPESMLGYNNDGPKPYRGITTDTCNISIDVRDKDILLIDDLYTKTVNIDEDAIQALLDHGARSVIFYAIGYTYR
jgi:hypothetical protein